MEDEEGYVALNVCTRKGRQLYPGTQEPKTQLSHQRWCQIIIGAGGVVFLLLAGAAIALRIFAFQTRQYIDALEKPSVSQELRNGTQDKTSLENVISHLKQFLCKPLRISLTESFKCKLCPQNWFRYGNKCYWVSKKQETWKKGQEDCKAKDSQMLVVQNQDEVAFIQSVIGETQLLWIGLTTTFPENKLTWVDGSSLDEKQLQELGPVEANSCGMLNGHQFIMEACSTVTTWVCETEAFDISGNWG
ncbi:killer cell lectin-like receptor subfamily F member 1 isoform X2 [Anolis carolinensis]|uniref:killer cell lectin-like receptor subfamily F member 1 isoform X2 n=1 Tax=Anolis carolinensis TaxID=28377 RepID=UPI0002C89181|nr:PREDICTED: killer cell lectin-like receptor subfamily F member 1 [Anolis carolinensis]|eukprot:XP_008103843.1 PREDICTED: killer cell lectin-like receptor subfamily F member 1 [Anolis carolinensis]